MIERGDWQVSDIARNAFDLENKVIGTIGAGRIGYRVLQRLKPFDPKELLYYDYAALPEGKMTFFLVSENLFTLPSCCPGRWHPPCRRSQGVCFQVRRRHCQLPPSRRYKGPRRCRASQPLQACM